MQIRERDDIDRISQIDCIALLAKGEGRMKGRH